MNIKIRALLIAAGIGVVFQVILSLIINVLTALPSMMGRDFPIEAVTLAPVVGVISCICVLIIDPCVGALYAYLHSREGGLTLGSGALGGALTDAVARVVTGLCNSCLVVLVMPLLTSGGKLSGDALATVVGASLIGAVLGVCIAVVIGAILGALGGVIAAAILGRNQKPPAPAVNPGM